MIFKATNIQNSKGIQGKPRKGQRPTRQHKCQREIKAKGKLRPQEQTKPRKGQYIVRQMKVKEKPRQTKAKATKPNQVKKTPTPSKANKG